MTAPSLVRRQKYLGEKGLIALITLLSAFVPLSTDLYLPALPGMALYFNAPGYLVNLTLILFFVFFSVGTLLWGPLSDKYGRKPVLLIGLSIYFAASIACAVSWDIYPLIAFRILQAIGGSAAFAVATAMVKDVLRQQEAGADFGHGPIHGFDISGSSPGSWCIPAEVHVLERSLLDFSFHRLAGFSGKHSS